MRAPSDALSYYGDDFLFIDRCTALDESSATCEGQFDVQAGHFRHAPVVPGVHLLEACAQTLAYWAVAHQIAQPLVLAGVEKARFKRPVRPGERVVYRVRVDRRLLNMVYATAIAEVDNRVVCRAQLIGAITEAT